MSNLEKCRMSPILINNIFLPLLGGTIVFVILEAITLAFDIIETAIGCRLIVILLLFLAYKIKCRVIERNIANPKCTHLIHSYSYFVACICLVTIVLQLFLLYFTKRKVYPLVICLISLIVFLDEYYDIEWLTEIQIVRRNTKNKTNRIRKKEEIPPEETDFVLIELDHQHTHEQNETNEYTRISLYNHVFIFLLTKMSLINDLFNQQNNAVI